MSSLYSHTRTGRGPRQSADPSLPARGAVLAILIALLGLYGGAAVRADGPVQLVSVNHLGTASGGNTSFPVAMSDDGRYLVFSSHASDIIPNDTNGKVDAFVRDLQT